MDYFVAKGNEGNRRKKERKKDKPNKCFGQSSLLIRLNGNVYDWIVAFAFFFFDEALLTD